MITGLPRTRISCRSGELLALDWESSVDFDGGTVRFHGTVSRVKCDAFVRLSGSWTSSNGGMWSRESPWAFPPPRHAEGPGRHP